MGQKDQAVTAPVDVLAAGPYWLTKFTTVSGIRSGAGNRVRVRLLDAVPGERGRYYRVMLPHRVVSIAAKADLLPIGAEE